MGAAHLDGIGDRPNGLRFQRGGTAIPELVEAPGAIQDGRGAATTLLPADAGGHRSAVCESVLRVVAGGARDGVVSREALVEIEQLAERYLLHGVRIIGRPGDFQKTQRRVGWGDRRCRKDESGQHKSADRCESFVHSGSSTFSGNPERRQPWCHSLWSGYR